MSNGMLSRLFSFSENDDENTTNLYNPYQHPYSTVSNYAKINSTCINVSPIEYLQKYTEYNFMSENKTKEKKMNSELLFEIKMYPYLKIIEQQKILLNVLNCSHNALSEELNIGRSTIVDKDLDIDFLNGFLEKEKNQNSNLSAKNLSLEMTLIDLQLEHNALLEKYNKQNIAIKKLQEILNEDTKEHEKLTGTNVTKELTINMLDNKIKFLKKTLGRLEQKNKNDTNYYLNEIENLKYANYSLVYTCSNLTQLYTEIKFSEERKNNTLGEVLNINTNLNNHIRELETEIYHLKSSYNFLQSENYQLKMNYLTLKKFVIDLQSKHDDLQSKHNDLVSSHNLLKIDNYLMENKILELDNYSSQLIEELINNKNDVKWLLDKVAELNRKNVRLEDIKYVLEENYSTEILNNARVMNDNILLQNLICKLIEELGLSQNDVKSLIVTIENLNKFNTNFKNTNNIDILKEQLNNESKLKENYKNEFKTVNLLLTKRDLEIVELKKQLKVLQRENVTNHRNLLINQSILKDMQNKIKHSKETQPCKFEEDWEIY